MKVLYKKDIVQLPQFVDKEYITLIKEGETQPIMYHITPKKNLVDYMGKNVPVKQGFIAWWEHKPNAPIRYFEDN